MKRWVTLTTFDRTDKRDICWGSTLGRTSVGQASLDRTPEFFNDEVEVVEYAKDEKLTRLILWSRGVFLAGS